MIVELVVMMMMLLMVTTMMMTVAKATKREMQDFLMEGLARSPPLAQSHKS